MARKVSQALNSYWCYLEWCNQMLDSMKYALPPFLTLVQNDDNSQLKNFRIRIQIYKCYYMAAKQFEMYIILNDFKNIIMHIQ